MAERVSVDLGEIVSRLMPYLDERQRRLALGAFARLLGHGGIRQVASMVGAAESTVSAGARELFERPGADGRVRAAGAGRPSSRAADPDLVPARMALVEPVECGDPETPLRWTVRSTRNLAEELTAAGHPVSHETVAALLKAEGFSLQGTHRTNEGAAKHADLTVVHLARRAGVLPLHPNRIAALLEEAGVPSVVMGAATPSVGATITTFTTTRGPDALHATRRRTGR